MIENDLKLKLSEHISKAEKKRCLVKEQLDIIYKQKWFKMFVPLDFGGLQLNLMEGLRLQEELAEIDGSLGWTVTLCSGANMFVGYLPYKTADEIFHDEKVCLGGSGAADGIVEITKKGLIVNGFWRFATGTPHLDYFTANCKLKKNGKLLLNPDGTETTTSIFFKKNEVNIIKAWDPLGLKATASQNFSVSELKVSHERLFAIDHRFVAINNELYKYPFLQFAETTLGVNYLGMFQTFLNECKKVASQNFTGTLACKIDSAEKKVKALKNKFYSGVENSLTEQQRKGHISAQTLATVSDSAKKMVKEILKRTPEVYQYCGLSNTLNGTPVNRIFRDLFTASQHAVFR